MKTIRATQADDDSWSVEIRHDSGLIEVLSLGPLSKDQLVRELQRRDLARGEIYDKRVMRAIREGRVVGLWSRS